MPRRTNGGRLRTRVLTLFSVAALVACTALIAGGLAIATQSHGYSTVFSVLTGALLVFLCVSAVHVWGLAQHHFEELQSALVQLREARRSAEAADKAKSNFLATVSHELRTPLNGVLGMTGLLLDGNLSSEQRTYANAVDVSAKSLLSIIDELLDAASVNSGELTVSKGKANLAEIVESVIELMAPRAHAKSIELASFVSPQLHGWFEGDALRLRQILLNLVGNAVKFTSNGGVLVRVEPGSGQDEIQFSVCDTGPGVPRNELDQIFARYGQSSSPDLQHDAGSGLGLSISRNLVELMGGSVGVESELGAGSTFHFTLGLNRIEGGDEPVIAPALGGVAAMLVMPEGPNRKALQLQLASNGADVVTATSVAQAKELVAKQSTDGRSLHILADANLLDAASARRALASNFGAAHKLWLVLKPEERRTYQKLIEGGELGYLVKPVRPATLMAQLGNVPVSSLGTDVESLVAVGPDEPAQGNQGLHVMLVEDNRINMLLARKMLSAAGHEVSHFKSGEEALLALEACIDELGKVAYDVVLMDIQMPGIDGYEAARRIRKLEASKGLAGQLPILALSANARRDDRKASNAAGMNGYMSKPFDRTDLERAIADLALERGAA